MEYLFILGLGVGDHVNLVYANQLATTLEWPQSLGIAGGRPNSALYFVNIILLSQSHHCICVRLVIFKNANLSTWTRIFLDPLFP